MSPGWFFLKIILLIFAALKQHFFVPWPFILPTCSQSYGEAVFCYRGPHLWNSLPGKLRAAETVSGFKKGLKTPLLV